MPAPRTLEILESMGIVNQYLDAGVVCPDVVVATQDLTVSYDELDSSFPFSLSLEQSKTERLLIRHLASFGVEVERRVSLRSFVKDDFFGCRSPRWKAKRTMSDGMLTGLFRSSRQSRTALEDVRTVETRKLFDWGGTSLDPWAGRNPGPRVFR